jgi:serine/threonine-protein kinase RsbW
METTSKSAEFQSLGLFRDFIEAICKAHPHVDDQTLYDLKLATDEACTNIITYGYVGMNPGTITLGCEVDSESVRVEITDFGQPRRLSEPLRPDIEASLENGVVGGFGLYFIYQTMDEVVYKTAESRNRLVLIKKLKGE